MDIKQHYYLKLTGFFILLLILIVYVFSIVPEDGDWPCFHGPNRDNLSVETGLLQAWPEDGPELLWNATGIGHGYSTVSISNGRIFTAGMIDKHM